MNFPLELVKKQKVISVKKQKTNDTPKGREHDNNELFEAGNF